MRKYSADRILKVKDKFAVPHLTGIPDIRNAFTVKISVMMNGRRNIKKEKNK